MALVLTNSQKEIFLDPVQRLFSKVNHKQSNELIIIVPTNRIVRNLKHSIIKNSTTAIPNLQIYTLELIMRKIYSTFGIHYFELEPDMQSILVEESIIKLLKENSLFFFKSRPDGKLPKGTFDKIFNLIREFRENGIYPEDLEKDIEIIDKNEIEKTTDIIKIYKEYNRRIYNRFVDKGEIYKIINEKFVYPLSNDYFRIAFPDANELFIYGFNEFTKIESNFLIELTKIKNLDVILSIDYNFNNLYLFGILKKNVDSFYNAGLKEYTFLKDQPEVLKDFIEKNLFNRVNKVQKRDFSEFISIVSAKDRITEVENIFKTIKSIIRKNPEQDLNNICIATYSTEKYTDLFREYSEKYGIPVNLTDRYVLNRSPLISSIISFLQIPVNNYRKKEVFRALLSPYLIFNNKKGEIIDAHSLYEIANSLKITFGKNNWIEKIDRKISILLKNRELEEDTKHIDKEIRILKEAKSNFECITELLLPFENKLNAAEFEEEIIKLLTTLNIHKQVLEIDKKDKIISEKDTRALYAFLSTLNKLKKLYQLKDTPNKKYSLSEYLSDLKIAISNTRYNLKQRGSHGVLITAAEETRGLSFDYMFIAGMLEGEFPPVYEREIFKPEVRRKTEEKHYLENRYLFYQVLTNFRKKVYISYPKFDNDVELIPSSFINSLNEIIISNDKFSEIEENVIYSLQDLQLLTGDLVLNTIEFPDSLHLYKNIYDNLKEKSAIELSRIKKHNLPQYEGIIWNNISDDLKVKLTDYKFKEYSISELEEYSKCPMRYFFSRIMNIESIEEVEDDITALEFGTIIHETLFTFFNNWKKSYQQKSFYEQSDLDFHSNLKTLTEIALEKVKELNITNPFFEIDFQKVIGDGNKINGILKNFLEFELKEKNKLFSNIFEPSYFEVSFGKNIGDKRFSDSTLSVDTSIVLENINIRGKVDRVDILKQNNKLLFIIFDYKTGKYIPGLKDITEGISLQLPIYILCIKKIFENISHYEIIPAGGVYYSLNESPEIIPGIFNINYFNNTRSKKVMEESEYSSVLNKSVEFIKEYINDISSGKFGYPKPERDLDSICRFCNYVTICRIKTHKTIEYNN